MHLCVCVSVWSRQIRALTSSFAASSFAHLCNSTKSSCPPYSPSLSQSPAPSLLQQITVNYIPYMWNNTFFTPLQKIWIKKIRWDENDCCYIILNYFFSTLNYWTQTTGSTRCWCKSFVHKLHINRYCVSLISFKIMLHLNWLPHVDLTFPGLKVSCNYMQQVMNVCSHNRKLIRILTCFSVTVMQV